VNRHSRHFTKVVLKVHKTAPHIFRRKIVKACWPKVIRNFSWSRWYHRSVYCVSERFSEHQMSQTNVRTCHPNVATVWSHDRSGWEGGGQERGREESEAEGPATTQAGRDTVGYQKVVGIIAVVSRAVLRGCYRSIIFKRLINVWWMFFFILYPEPIKIQGISKKL